MNKRPVWRAETGWLDGAAYDSVFIIGVLTIALLSGIIVLINPALFYPVLIADLWLLGYHHVIATFTKMAGTKADRKENWFLIYVLPFLVLGLVAALYVLFGVWAVVTVYFFWQWWHYTRQSYGIAAFYRRKAENPTTESRWLLQSAIWAIPVWGLTHRLSQGWEEFLFLPIWLPVVPERLVMVAGLISMGVLAWWAYQRFVDYRDGQLSMGKTLFELSHFVVFFVGYVLINDINIGWLVANVWHNAQYILFVWLYNTNRFGKQPDEAAEGIPNLLAWVSKRKPIRILLYFVFTLVLTSVFYQSVNELFVFIAKEDVILLSTLYVVGYQTINFHHYVVDSIIWKARNRKNQTVMKIVG